MIRLLRFWLMEQRALARSLDDAHRALTIAHRTNQLLLQQVSDTEAVSGCCGRVEHIRLAARAERYEGLYHQRVAPTETLTTLGLREGDGG